MSWTTTSQELRHALRRLARTPGFAALAVTTLALGLGAHVAVFTLVDAMFLRPWALPEPDRLVGVYESRDGEGYFPLSFPDYLDYRDRTRVFGGLAAHYAGAPLSLATEDRLEEINGSVVSTDYFAVLGVEPARGRFFLREEGEVRGKHPVAVVSHDFWRSRLNGRDDVLGTVIHLNGTPFTVVGVAPEGFDGVRLGRPSEVWIPTGMGHVGYRWCDTFERDCTWLTLIGRLGPGHTLEQARSEMARLSRRVREAHPAGSDILKGLSVAPLRGVHPALQGRMLRLAGLLLAAVTLVVLVAGANLAGLLVGRGLARRQEIAVRRSLGAPRHRILSLFLAETLWLSLAGGAVGLVLAPWFGRLLALLYPSDVPIDLDVRAPVVLYAAVLSAGVALLVAVVPGLQANRPSLVPALKDEVSGGLRGRPKVLGLLVVVQVALCLVLLTGTGLLVRSLASTDRLGSVNPESVATLRLRPRLVGYGPHDAQTFTREAVRRLEALPGVHSVSLGQGLAHLPFFDPVRVDRPGEGGQVIRGPAAWINQVAPRFFETNGIALLQGRDFDARDRVDSPPVAIVNRTLATALWPGGDPVGRRVTVGEEQSFEVVGVVEDAIYRNITERPQPQIYAAYWQNPDQVDARLCVRTSGDAGRLLPSLRRAIFEIDPDVPVTEVETLESRLRSELASVHLAGRVLGAAGGLALFLSAVGLFGVQTLAVTRRTREIGIRMALGGDRLRVVAAVVRDALFLVGLALGVGVAASLMANQALAHYLYGVSPRDPLTFAAVLLVLAVTAALASWWPARRAARVDPMVALREG